jgi:transposase-like protein
MPRPYSADLRERALRACERAEASRAAIARRFEVAEATLYGWLKQDREEGRRAAKPHAGGPAPTIDAAGLEVVRGLVEEDRRHAGRVRRAPRRAHRAAGQLGGDVPDAAAAPRLDA